MVGGRIINVISVGPNSWIQCEDSTGDVCAIRVVGKHNIRIGDSIWWQGQIAYWTRMPHMDGQPTDIKLERIGHSHGKIPDDVLEIACA